MPATRRNPVDLSILTSGHDVADARLHRVAAALLAAGLRVEVLGLGEAAGAPPGTDVTTWPRAAGAARAALALRMAARARGRVLFTLDPDSALAAHAVVLASGRELIVDVHEDYAALLADRAWTTRAHGVAGKVAARVVSGFQRIAGRAALTVVADEHLPPLRARRRLVVPNAPDPQMLPTPGAPADRPLALYVGDARASRGLFAMLHALAAAPEWSLQLVGPIAGADEPRLRDLLQADPGLAARVDLRGRLEPRKAWADAAHAWCGLLLLADTPAFREALPSKAREYLACGLPVVTTDLPRQVKLVQDAGAGVVVPCGDDESVGQAVAQHLQDWAADPAPLLALRSAAAGAGAITDSAYATLAAAVADLL